MLLFIIFLIYLEHVNGEEELWVIIESLFDELWNDLINRNVSMHRLNLK